MKVTLHKLHTFVRVPAIIAIAVMTLLVGGAAYVSAETYPGGEDNGKTSRLKQLNEELVSLGYGSVSNSPDWGADWNRISTAAKWHPNGDITPGDVAEGKKFYNGSRTEQTGTVPLAGPCPAQDWEDSADSANETDNCSISWAVATPAKPGDDKQDPRTNLVWSKCLANSDGAVSFSSAVCSGFSWLDNGINNLGRTAKQLCSDRGDGWRLPTQKELMQAYIDGSYYNLSAATSYYWSTTEASDTNAWHVNLATGYTRSIGKTSMYRVVCVR